MNTKTLHIKGITIYPLTDVALHKALHNPNSVILLASIDDMFTPVFFQRYADYIDKASLTKAGLVEALTPYVIDPTKYPMAHSYNEHYNLLDREEETS